MSGANLERRLATLERDLGNMMMDISTIKRQLEILNKQTPDANAMALTIRKNVDSVVAATIDAKIAPQIKQINKQLYELQTDDTMIEEYRSRVMGQAAVQERHRPAASSSSTPSHSLLAFQDN